MNNNYMPLREKLIAKARERGSFFYSEIAPDLRVNMGGLDKDRAELGRILGEISKFEASEGRPMLSAIVVSRGGDGMPGEGFFKLALELFPVGDRMLFWVSEVKRVHDYWSRQS